MKKRIAVAPARSPGSRRVLLAPQARRAAARRRRRLQRTRRQPVVPAQAGHPLRVHRRQGRPAVTRRRRRHAPDEDHRRRRPASSSTTGSTSVATSRERTTDWYSQDSRGNVWYFGENTAELDARGHVTSTEGTWTAGVDGAKAGIYMPADPHVGQTGRQEYYKGHAEDHFKVIGLLRRRHRSRARRTRCSPRRRRRSSRATIDHKMYVRGIGTVLEQTEKGGDERNELVAVTCG